MWKATSSMRHVVPGFRVPPTEADGPVLRILFGLVGEAYGCVGLESGKALFYCTDVLPQFFRAAGFGLGQHGGQSGLVSRFYAGQGG